MNLLILSSGLSFDSVMLVPQKSLPSRFSANPATEIAGLHLYTPIISANMDSITSFEVAAAMHQIGGLGILHRYALPEEICDWIRRLVALDAHAVPSVGIKEDDVRSARNYWRAGARTVCVDIANAYSDAAALQVRRMREIGFQVIAGNVATLEGATFLAEAGAHSIKVGISGGSVCHTKFVTGHGRPQWSAVVDCAQVKKTHPKVTVISDGSIRTSGDIVKALGAGGDAVMCGGLLAGTKECPTINGRKIYRGMASSEARSAFSKQGGSVGQGAAEGISKEVAERGSVIDLVQELTAGIRSGMSYSGARTIKELQEKAKFEKIWPF